MKNVKLQYYGVRRRVAALDGDALKAWFVFDMNGNPAQNIQSGDTSPHSIQVLHA